MTMHLSPTSSDPERYLARTGRRPVVHLDHLGVLGPHLLLAHGVWFDDAEIELVLRRAPRSPTARGRTCGSGRASRGRDVTPTSSNAAAGSRSGCDASNAGDVADILRAAAAAAGIARDTRIDPTRFGAHEAFELATIAGAEAIGMADRIGSLEPGKQADIVVHRADGWGWSPRGDIGLQLVWGTDGRSRARRLRRRPSGRPRWSMRHRRHRRVWRDAGAVQRRCSTGPGSSSHISGPMWTRVESGG